MSRASKLTLLGTSAFAVVTVVFVHFQQDAEKRVGEGEGEGVRGREEGGPTGNTGTREHGPC